MDLSPTLQVMSVAAKGISYAEINVTNPISPFAWVVDDLIFETGPTTTRLSSWGDVKMIYR
jgi:hypothetical protein